MCSTVSPATGAGHRFRQRCRDAVPLVPKPCRRADQRCDLPGRFHRCLHRTGCVRPDRVRAGRRMNPVGHGSCKSLDIGRKRRIVAGVRGGMIAHNVDDRARRAARVVQVGETIGKPGAEMQQRAGRLAGHSRVAVGRSRDHALEQSSTGRIPSTESSAATKCISDVPGFPKHTSTPLAISERNRLSAPFMVVTSGCQIRIRSTASPRASS